MILLIGGMGFIGLNTALRLLEVGEPVVITQHSSHRIPDLLKDEIGKRVFTARMDVTNAYEVFEVVRQAVPDARCAALKPGRTPNASTNPAEDLSRIKADVGYEPQYTIETGVAAYIDWLRSHPH